MTFECLLNIGWKAVPSFSQWSLHTFEKGPVTLSLYQWGGSEWEIERTGVEPTSERWHFLTMVDAVTKAAELTKELE